MSDSRGVPILVPVTGALEWDWRESYLVLLAFVVPGALWVEAPILVPAVFTSLIIAGLTLRIRRIARWWPLLRFGRIVAADSVSQESAGSGTVRVSHAERWQVERGW